MSEKIKSLRTAELTEGFGKIAEGKSVRNLVVNCTFGAANKSKFSVTGEKAVYTANLNVSEEDWEECGKDKEECLKRFKRDLQKALDDGSFVLYGHLVNVKDATDGKHKSVYNKNTKHTIESFAQALETESAENALSFISRNITRNIESGRFLWEAPKD